MTCREESEKVSELKNMSGTARLPYGTLALGAEGIKEAINSFDDAYVRFLYLHTFCLRRNHFRRRSDIENERLPPELVDANSEEGKALVSMPNTPVDDFPSHPFNGPQFDGPKLRSSPGFPSSPVSPTSPSGTPFKRGHGRQASLGTTMTSPSTRRRSIENTMSLIQDAWDGKKSVPEVSELVDRLSGTRVASGATPPRS